ncbi:MAG: DUF1700 domain-containing protein [Eubacterium sp.]|nr:DUF1700 domain-containing protein [Eubacterium sp.]
MNKYEFLAQLRNALSSVPQEEREAAMSYYEEFFSEAGEENEQAVIASLGSPEELAKSIINENKDAGQAADTAHADASGFDGNSFTPPPTPAQQNTGWSGGQIALIVILLILSFPIWIGLVAAVFGILFGLFAALIGIIIAFGACAISALGISIGAFFTGAPVAGLFSFGIALFFAGLFPLAIYPLCKLLVKLTKVCCSGIAALFRKLTGRKGVA